MDKTELVFELNDGEIIKYDVSSKKSHSKAIEFLQLTCDYSEVFAKVVKNIQLHSFNENK